MRLPTLLAAQPSCTCCHLHDQGESIPRNVGVPTIHLPNSKAPDVHIPAVVYLGRNPGFNEDMKGEPFIGRAGRVLKEVYIGGIQGHLRASIYLTNFVRCHTISDEPPGVKCFSACAPYFVQDMTAISHLHRQGPRILVLLGAQSTREFFRKVLGQRKGPSLTKAFNQNGEEHRIPLADGSTSKWVVYATYHPAYLLYDRNQISAVHGHNDLINRSLAGLTPEASEPQFISTRFPQS